MSYSKVFLEFYTNDVVKKKGKRPCKQPGTTFLVSMKTNAVWWAAVLYSSVRLY